MLRLNLRQITLSGLILAAAVPVAAQMPGASGPPAVGVVTVTTKPVIDRTEISGRVQATDRVSLVARVTGFLDKQLFVDGADVKKGDLLFRLERGPFIADLEIKKAQVAQQQAVGELADLNLTRATQLLAKDAGSQSTADNAKSAQKGAQALIASAKAQMEQAQINLDYTEIRSPIDGRIGRSAVTPGNVVGPNTGTLAMVVSQDPMYVVFPISVRALEELRSKTDGKGGIESVPVTLRLPNGRIYSHTGKIDFVDTSVTRDTDTITMRAVVANPSLSDATGSKVLGRELINDEFVTVVIEAAAGEQLPSIPRAAVVSDQQGDFVYVVGADNKVEQRRIKRGPSTPQTTAIASGLKDGETIVLEGLQRVRPGVLVAPQPVAAQPGQGK